jgi:hypothetical protein
MGSASTEPCQLALGAVFPDPSTSDHSGPPERVEQYEVGAGFVWAGYVRSSEVEVDVSYDDRAVVRDVLDSVTFPGVQPIG